MFRRTCAAVAAVTTTAFGLIVAGAGAASAADANVALSLTGFGGIAVAGNHVFVLGGPNDGVVVRNLDGSADRVISEPTPTGIAASADGGTVYVALGAAHEIVAIDGTTLAITTYDTGAGTCPATFARLGTSLYFGEACSGGSGTIGVVDLSVTPATVTTGLVTGLQSAPPLAANDAVSSRIFAAIGGTVQAYDIGSGGALTAGPSASAGDNFRGMAITTDGADVVTASGYPYDQPRFKTSDLSADGQYTTAAYPNAVATGGAGWVAAGIQGWYDPDVYLFDAAGKRTRTYDFGACCNPGDSVILAPNGLAFGSSALYAVTEDIDNTTFRLRVLRDAMKYPVTLSATGPTSAARARGLTVTGKLTASGTPLSAVHLTVTKTDLAGTHSLAGVTTSSTGAYTIHDTPTVGGTNTYTVSFAGDATRAAASRSVRVTVSRAATALSISTNRSAYGYGQRQYVKVHLGTTYDGRIVTVREREADTATWHVVRSARVDSHGNLSTSFVAHRTATITAGFAGDYRYAPRTVTIKRSVRATIATAIAGTYATSGKYHLMHESKGGAIAAGVKPLHPGRTVVFRLEVLQNGRWKVADAEREALNEHGVTAAAFFGRTNTPLRIRAEFTGDPANAAVAGKWWYVQFR